MIKIYGIKQCSTMKKTFDWFAAHELSYEFHDYKKFGVTAEQLKEWVARLGWQALVNTKGTTWRKLPESVREHITEQTALTLMQEQPSLIKRPLVQTNKALLVGYDEEKFVQILKEKQ